MTDADIIPLLTNNRTIEDAVPMEEKKLVLRKCLSGIVVDATAG
jgi:hypothetical protein